MEELLDKDIRVKNAKVRLQERANKVKEDTSEGGNDAKRRRLQEIEDQAMREEDPAKLSNLFEEYRKEYLKDRDGNEEESKRQRVQDTPVM